MHFANQKGKTYERSYPTKAACIIYIPEAVSASSPPRQCVEVRVRNLQRRNVVTAAGPRPRGLAVLSGVWPSGCVVGQAQGGGGASPASRVKYCICRRSRSSLTSLIRRECML